MVFGLLESLAHGSRASEARVYRARTANHTGRRATLPGRISLRPGARGAGGVGVSFAF